MRKVKVFARMCEEETGGFVTGIGTETKTYTEKEFRNNKHLGLTAGIEMIEGCYWSWSLEWIKSKQMNNQAPCFLFAPHDIEELNKMIIKYQSDLKTLNESTSDTLMVMTEDCVKESVRYRNELEEVVETIDLLIFKMLAVANSDSI